MPVSPDADAPPFFRCQRDLQNIFPEARRSCKSNSPISNLCVDIHTRLTCISQHQPHSACASILAKTQSPILCRHTTPCQAAARHYLFTLETGRSKVCCVFMLLYTCSDYACVIQLVHIQPGAGQVLVADVHNLTLLARHGEICNQLADL